MYKKKLELRAKTRGKYWIHFSFTFLVISFIVLTLPVVKVKTFTWSSLINKGQIATRCLRLLKIQKIGERKATIHSQTWCIQQVNSSFSTIATTWPFWGVGWGGVCVCRGDHFPLFWTSREARSVLPHKGHLCCEALHGSVLSYGKLSKLPLSPYYPDRRQKGLPRVFPVH